MVQPPWKTRWSFLKKWITKLPDDPATPLLDIFPWIQFCRPPFSLKNLQWFPPPSESSSNSSSSWHPMSFIAWCCSGSSFLIPWALTSNYFEPLRFPNVFTFSFSFRPSFLPHSWSRMTPALCPRHRPSLANCRFLCKRLFSEKII